MAAGDLLDFDAVAIVLDALRSDARLRTELDRYGAGTVSGEVKPPYPCVVVRPTGGIETLRWRSQQNVSVWAVGNRDGSPGDGALRDILVIALLAAYRIQDEPVTDAMDPVVNSVENTIGPQPLDPVGGHPRWQGQLQLIGHPPIEAPAL